MDGVRPDPKRTALVTGAAGGIGAAVVRTLAREGLAVAAVDRDTAALEELEKELADQGRTIAAVPADLSRTAEARAAVETAVARLGHLDHLVNAAGVLRLGEARGLSEEDWHTSLAVNATGVFAVSQAAVPHLADRGSGAVVTVASNAAATPRTGMAAYAASKAAAVAFTKCLGLELAAQGVRCNVVAPGSTDTPMLRSMWSGEADRQATLRGNLEHHRLGIPLGRVAAPDDIAGAVAFLLSDAARHITLHTLTVDGGATLGA
ncbi:2,3-dihydro-2,3-dihydroxybenzoate dehydrogenase [Nocardiopsis baichengensis]|uniref:2,3-dihydro-2,3-dihydroxybenzoate dehydrogenase n=1 Tax=Nocardiopsis baichengensis TaxID=280240 RepID=UPI00034A62BF|nr:2,3-dihydro-2,3-dihydroxybenzoate dehydrogenase [Nocardiopsis baichengensis]